MAFTHFMMNKPPGCICARVDLRGRPVIYAHVPTAWPALPHVGRLDFNSEGLLLFTDDGRLNQALLNREFRARLADDGLPPIEKEYHVKVRDLLEPDDPRVEFMRVPFTYTDGTVTHPAEVEVLEHRARATWIRVTLTEGRWRQVRMLCARSRLQVVKLRRVRIGPLALGDLKTRWCRPLTLAELEALYAAALPEEPLPPCRILEDPALAEPSAATPAPCSTAEAPAPSGPR